jgi:hypothetical protein
LSSDEVYSRGRWAGVLHESHALFGEDGDHLDVPAEPNDVARDSARVEMANE